MSKLKIVHFSPTPLVGAPSKIVAVLKKLGFDSHWIIEKDYPIKGPLYEKFSHNAISLDGISPILKGFVIDIIRDADVIHIHNDISQSLAEWFYSLNSSAKYIYQVHSPLREGPLYIERSQYINLPFYKKMVVAQYQPRQYQNFILVPNLVLDPPSIELREDAQKLKVLFSPTHSRKGRWNAKYSLILEKALNALNDIQLIDVLFIDKPVKPTALMDLRRKCHVSIDEIVTGAYHQISLEGLCAGNVVLNRADFFSKWMLKNVASSEQMPPFINVNDDSIVDVLVKLALEPELCRSLQKRSYNYFVDYLQPERLIENFIRVYNA